jgi:ankyrin repeat protein
VKYLFQKGALLDLRSDHHSTALMLAVQTPNNEEVVKFLIDQGADVRFVDLDGDSAIDIAKRKHLDKELQWLEARATQSPTRLPSSTF